MSLIFTCPPNQLNQVGIGSPQLAGTATALAIEKGLAEATWYASPVPKEKMRELLTRRDWPAKGVKLLRIENNAAVLSVQSGAYRFSSTVPKAK